MDWATLLTDANIGGLFDGIQSALPSILPIAVGYLGVRKTISFIMGTLRRC